MADPTPQPVTPTLPAAAPGEPKRYLCPYCGSVSDQPRRCSACSGHLDPLSRQATQNTMGPWQIRDAGHPFRPGCSYATIRKLIQRGQITRRTILRGPTTRQFWTFADRAPAVANLLGVCHNCHAKVASDAFLCGACGASFTPETDRQYLGLAPRRPLPGEAPADEIAQMASDNGGPSRDRLYADQPERPARPAFPADPRPARRRRSPLAAPAIIAIIAVAGAIGLALGAAAALAVAASVGMIDLGGLPGAGGSPQGGPPLRGGSDTPSLPEGSEEPAEVEPAPPEAPDQEPTASAPTELESTPEAAEPPASTLAPEQIEPAGGRDDPSTDAEPPPPAGPVVPPKLRDLP